MAYETAAALLGELFLCADENGAISYLSSPQQISICNTPIQCIDDKRSISIPASFDCDIILLAMSETALPWHNHL